MKQPHPWQYGSDHQGHVLSDGQLLCVTHVVLAAVLLPVACTWQLSHMYVFDGTNWQFCALPCGCC